MPKNGHLSTEERRLFWHWLEMGAPKDSEGLPPDQNQKPLIATYDSINEHIFQKVCVDCHSPGKSGKRVPLDKESLLNSPLELVLPGNPDESGLVVAIERNDEKRMPPAKEGYSTLKAEEKAAIRKWIENNAKD
jgi:mono/diheme cytochrome c family protein